MQSINKKILVFKNDQNDLSSHIYFFKSLLSVIFEFLTPKNLHITKFQDEKMTRTIVITKNIIKNGGFYPETPISVKFSNLNNFGTVRS